MHHAEDRPITVAHDQHVALLTRHGLARPSVWQVAAGIGVVATLGLALATAPRWVGAPLASAVIAVETGCLVGIVCLAGYRLRTERVARARAEASLRDSYEAMAYQAQHDPLTGLANRARFRDRLARTLGMRPMRGGVAVLLLDLDAFKRVNDSLGHAAGDHLLAEVSARLLNATRGCDTVARLGGDEFAVLLENVRRESDAIVVAERILHALQGPFLLESAQAYVGASIGIALMGASSDAGVPGSEITVDTLLRDADLAMYRAKLLGKGRYALFEPDMRAVAVGRLALETDLRGAIEREEIRLVYQPIVELATGRVRGVEALARWQHPTRGAVPPGDFIPFAEETGLIVPLGRWVLREACRQAACWHRWQATHDPGLPPLTVSVNVSGRQLQSELFVDDVANALRDSGMATGTLMLELTESTVVEDPDLVVERINVLQALGVRLAIDDFGTGYSALSYLHRFPVDVLKIDKSFVDGLTRGGSNAALARAIVALGNALSLPTVAEGIEHAAQCEYLREIGCALGQGYHFARPLERTAVDAFLATLYEAAEGVETEVGEALSAK